MPVSFPTNYGGENFSSRNPSARNYSVPGGMRSSKPNSIVAKLKLAQPVLIMWGFQRPELSKILHQQPEQQTSSPSDSYNASTCLTALVQEPRKSQDCCLNIWIKNANLNHSTCPNPHWHLSLSSYDFHVSLPMKSNTSLHCPDTSDEDSVCFMGELSCLPLHYCR